LDQAEINLEQAREEIKRIAARRAEQRARVARWDLDVAVFLFAVLIIVIILLFQGVAVEIVSPIALFGLVMVWLVGWRRGKQLYKSFYQEELSRLERTLVREKTDDQKIAETIEEKVQKALRERWK
jgi:type IV secretory pathway TrbL component